MITQIPWGTVIWAVVALSLIIILYFILGRKMGKQGIKSVRFQSAQSKKIVGGLNLQPPPLPESEKNKPKKTDIVIDEPANSGVVQIKTVLPNFSVDSFLKDFEKFFSDVLKAYEKNDIVFLEKNVSPSVEQSFSHNIDRLSKLHLKPKINIIKIDKIILQSARLNDFNGAEYPTICLKIISWQINCAVNGNGDVIEGTGSSTQFRDIWELFYDKSHGAGSWRLNKTNVF